MMPCPRVFLWVVLVCGLAAGAARPAAADTIVEFTDTDSDVVDTYVGQSVTTPSGGPWNNIVFNWFSDSLPSASGKLFLFTQEYVGTPQDLSAAAPGFLASTAASGLGDVYAFDPAVTLAPATQYFFYSADPGNYSNSTSDAYPGGNAFTSVAANVEYADRLDQDMDFRLSGTVAAGATPEPASGALFGLGALGLFACGWQRRKRRG